MSTDAPGYITLVIQRVGDQVLIEFDTGEALVLDRRDAVLLADSLRHVATRGPDRLDDIHELNLTRSKREGRSEDDDRSL